MIQLKNLLPHPLKELGIPSNTQIWGKELVFEKGKNYLVVAASGKGKSTLLHCMYGLRKDFDGDVYLKKKDIKSYSSDELAEVRQHTFSIVFQDLRLFEQLTALENITLKSDLQQYKTKAEIEAMADQLSVAHLLEKPCGTLSFGQRQRMAIIRALCQPFDFLLLDEPFSHLDEANIKAATQLIQTECQKQNSGIILVSLGEPYFFQYDESIIL
ncbi:MAG: ATP-binding cassette domain-containing protein [Bacteroidota bacterium]